MRPAAWFQRYAALCVAFEVTTRAFYVSLHSVAPMVDEPSTKTSSERAHVGTVVDSVEHTVRHIEQLRSAHVCQPVQRRRQ